VTSPRGAGSDPHLEGLRRATCATPYEYHARRTRHARPAGTAAGLGRRTPNGPERLPSDRPEPCGPSGLVVRVVHLHGFTPHPVACREPGPPRQRLERSLQATSPTFCSPRVAPRSAVPTRKMRLSDFCNQRSTREPYGLPDSRLPSRSRSLAGAIPICADLPSANDLQQIPGGASLDGEPPASALPQPSRRDVRGRDPEH